MASMVSFTPRPLYPPGKQPLYPLGTNLLGTRSMSRHFGKDKDFLLLPGIERFPVIHPMSLYTSGMSLAISVCGCNVTPSYLDLETILPDSFFAYLVLVDQWFPVAGIQPDLGNIFWKTDRKKRFVKKSVIIHKRSKVSYTVIPRLMKIIRSGITFVSRNVMLSGVSLLAVSNVNNPVGLVGLPYVMWSAHFFVSHTYRRKR